MISAISFGADPAQTRCVACTTESGNPGFEVRIFGTL